MAAFHDTDILAWILANVSVDVGVVECSLYDTGITSDWLFVCKVWWIVVTQ